MYQNRAIGPEGIVRATHALRCLHIKMAPHFHQVSHIENDYNDVFHIQILTREQFIDILPVLRQF